MKRYAVFDWTKDDELRQLNNRHYKSPISATAVALHWSQRKEKPHIVLAISVDDRGFPVIEHYTTVTWEGVHITPGDEIPGYATLRPPER